MFSTIKSIFSSEKVVEGVSNGLDKMFLTNEEKLDNWERLLTLYEPFKLAQRLIALTLLFCLAMSFLLAAIVRIGGWLFYDPSPEILNLVLQGTYTPPYIETSEWLVLNAYKLFFEPFTWAVIFYYGGGASEGLVNAWKNRNKGFLGTVAKKANAKEASE